MRSAFRFSREFVLTLLTVIVVGLLLLAKTFSREDGPVDQTYIPKKEVITPEIRLLQQYVSINTSNPPGNESAGARFLQQTLRERGINSELIESTAGRGNLYARVRGRRSGEGLMLLHHIDVVGADATTWKKPPFEARIELNEMWGRGTLDMKGIGICHLEAFSGIVRRGVPERDVVFLATADEEHSTGHGMEWLLANRPEIFEGIRYVLTEGGLTEVIGEKLVYFAIETGSKQFSRVELRGDAENLRRARIALEPWFDPKGEARLLPEVSEYFKAIAPHRFEWMAVLADIETVVSNGDEWRLAKPYRDLMQSSLFAFEIRKSGDTHVMDVVLHALPDLTPEEAARPVSAVADRFDLEMRFTKRMGPAPMSSTRTPMFDLLRRQIQAQFGPVDVGPVIVPYITTDSRFLRVRGIECYGFWPYQVNFFQAEGIHGVDERLRLDWFMQGVGLMKRIVNAWAFDEAGNRGSQAPSPASLPHRRQESAR